MEVEEYKPYAGYEALLIYDAKNLPSPCEILREIPRMIQRRFPGISIKYELYANTENLLPDHRAIMHDLFTFATEYGPPNLVVLVSGDRDFSTPLRVINSMKFTTMLICPSHAHDHLKKSAHFVYDWGSILGKGFKGGPSDLPVIKELPRGFERPDLNSDEQTVVMWDMDSVALPAHVHHMAATERIIKKVIKPNINMDHVGVVSFIIHGSRLPGTIMRADGVAYVETSTDSRRKELHMETKMITSMGEFIYENGREANVIIVSRNTNFASSITWLVHRGHTVGLVGGIDSSMREAASFNAPIPRWYTY